MNKILKWFFKEIIYPLLSEAFSSIIVSIIKLIKDKYIELLKKKMDTKLANAESEEEKEEILSQFKKRSEDAETTTNAIIKEVPDIVETGLSKATENILLKSDKTDTKFVSNDTRKSIYKLDKIEPSLPDS